MPKPRKTMRIATTVATVGTALLLAGSIAAAQQPRPLGACAADIRTKCAGIEPGEGRIASCVRSHFSELSRPCQARLARVAAVARACSSDVKQSCTGMARRRGGVYACVEGVLGNVSDTCKAVLARVAAGRR
jgi:hypothetical protein